MTQLNVRLDGKPTEVTIQAAIVAGWTGRNRAAVENHIAELEELGVPRPSRIPVFYRVSASRVTTAPVIEAPAASSGEVEAVILQHGGRLWVGVGSDHTDREVETYSVAVSKQVCDKPIAEEFWRYEAVVPRWDSLTLRSWVDGGTLYQEGTLSALLHPDDLLRGAGPEVGDGTLIFCGTLAALNGIRPASTFRYEISDTVLGRTIGGEYEHRDLPLVS